MSAACSNHWIDGPPGLLRTTAKKERMKERKRPLVHLCQLHHQLWFKYQGFAVLFYNLFVFYYSLSPPPTPHPPQASWSHSPTFTCNKAKLSDSSSNFFGWKISPHISTVEWLLQPSSSPEQEKKIQLKNQFLFPPHFWQYRYSAILQKLSDAVKTEDKLLFFK